MLKAWRFDARFSGKREEADQSQCKQFMKYLNLNRIKEQITDKRKISIVQLINKSKEAVKMIK